MTIYSIDDHFDENELPGLYEFEENIEDHLKKICDPEEIINANIEKNIDEYQEGICMHCGKKVDYDLYCMSATGDGPCVCWECAGEPEY